MLLLILSHRHIIRLIQKNIRSHQDRVGEKAGVDVVAVFRGLVLELGHPGELAEHSVTIQHPCELAVGGDM